MISKDFYKKPIFYYIIVPILIAVWPCFVALVWLPNSKKAFANEQKIYSDANTVMMDILGYDPERTKNPGTTPVAKGFDYVNAISDAARLCSIATPNITTQGTRTVEGKRMQDASVILQSVKIDSFANFIFLLQKRWANLECDSITLDKQKGYPDSWKITVKFRYHY